MKRFVLLCGVLLFGQVRAVEAPAGFTALFNGKDLSGWRGGTTYDHRQWLELAEGERAALVAKWNAELKGQDGKPHWTVEGGELVNDGAGSYLTTERDYGNFELRAEWKILPVTDSGIYLRGVPQVQIWDPTQPDPQHHGAAKGSGGLWNNEKTSPGRDPLVRADRPTGQWNRFRILMVGSRVSVWLNEKLVVDHALLEDYYDKKLAAGQRRPVPARGPIQLQTHNGGTRWRNIFVREIGVPESTRVLAGKGQEGFQAIFNGRDLDGWAGPKDAVSIKDGVIRWMEKKGGTLYWNRELADFQARLMFKVPPGGNNGLAIRYPGSGDTAYVGMTELQVLDENYDKVKGKIDPRQVHGSVYGMVGAARGYQHPIGEWNFQEVTVQGSRIKVELNGTVILDADVATVDLSKVMANKAHPGKDRKSGFFGFAGHNDPVEFKDVSIKPL
jgi:hypothetical protein